MLKTGITKIKSKYTLSPAEQMLLSYLTKNSLVSSSTLREIYKSKRISSPSYFKVVISSLIKKNILLRVKKGLYYVIMGESYDEFLLGQYLFGGYIGFSTALWLHGLKTELPTVCYIIVYKGKKEKRIGRMLYKSVSLGKKAIGSVYLGRYNISTKAKTFFDCFYFPKYSGGFNQIVYSLSVANLTIKEWNEFLDYIKMFGSSSMIQRTGYILTLLRRRPKAIPEFVLKQLKIELRKKGTIITRLDPSSKMKGKFIDEWKIYDNVGEERILAGL